MKTEKLKMQNGTRRLPLLLHFSFLAFSFSFPRLLKAQDAVTLPLQGFYHPGKYMPVHVAVSPQSSDESVNLISPGAVATYVAFEARKVDTIVPWLPIDPRARGVTWVVAPRGASHD